jgi:hypothetical protein
VNEASAEPAELSKVARLGQRPLLRKSMARGDPDSCRRVPGAVIRVQRFFEPVNSYTRRSPETTLARGARLNRKSGQRMFAPMDAFQKNL